MPIFFSEILKKKKFLACVFFFLITLGIILPVTASATWNPACWSVWGNPKAGSFRGDYCYYNGEQDKAIMSKVSDLMDAAARPVFNAVVMAFGMILIVITGTLSGMAAGILGWVMSPNFLAVSYTGFDNQAVATGWPMVRDLANMIIVLGFIVIGIATALRFQDYEAKKLLPRLIGAAILINFSLLICGIFIDASNITTVYFTKSSGYMAKDLTVAIGDQTKDLWANYQTGDVVPILGAATGLVFFNLMAFIIFMLFAFLFLFRYMALWILVILSPLAFVCAVFPATQSFWSMWKKNFIQWCIIGIPASFFLWVADKIAANFRVSSAPTGGNPSLGAYLVPGAFLIAGFIFSIQTSAMGVGVVTNAFKKYGGKTAKGLGGAAAELSGRIPGAQKSREYIANKWAGAQEATGFASRGYQAQQKQARAKKAGEQVEALANAPIGSGDHDRYKQLVDKGTGAMGAAAVAYANKNGELGQILGFDANRMSQRAATAGAFGYKKKEFTDKNWQLAGEDENLIKTKRESLGLANDVDGNRIAKSAVNADQVSKNWKDMSVVERANVNLKSFEPDHAKDLVFKHGADLADATRTLTKGSKTYQTRIDNADIMEAMIGNKIGSKGADLDSSKLVDAAIEKADDGDDINTARKLRELRSKTRTIR